MDIMAIPVYNGLGPCSELQVCMVWDLRLLATSLT